LNSGLIPGKNKKQSPDLAVDGAGNTYIVDVLLEVDPSSVSQDRKSKFDKPKPALGTGQPGEMEVLL